MVIVSYGAAAQKRLKMDENGSKLEVGVVICLIMKKKTLKPAKGSNDGQKQLNGS